MRKHIVELDTEGQERYKTVAEAVLRGQELTISINGDRLYNNCVMKIVLSGNMVSGESQYQSGTVPSSVERFNPFTWEFDWIEDSTRYLIRNAS